MFPTPISSILTILGFFKNILGFVRLDPIKKVCTTLFKSISTREGCPNCGPKT